MLDKIWRFIKQLIQRLFGTSFQDSNPPWPPLGKGGKREKILLPPLPRVGRGRKSCFPPYQGWEEGENLASPLTKREINLASPLTKGGLRGVLPTLTDAEYEAKLMELLEGVNGGWDRDDVAGFLIAKQIKNGDLAAWLRRFGSRLLEGAQESKA